MVNADCFQSFFALKTETLSKYAAKSGSKQDQGSKFKTVFHKRIEYQFRGFGIFSWNLSLNFWYYSMVSPATKFWCYFRSERRPSTWPQLQPFWTEEKMAFLCSARRRWPRRQQPQLRSFFVVKTCDTLPNCGFWVSIQGWQIFNSTSFVAIFNLAKLQIIKVRKIGFPRWEK